MSRSDALVQITRPCTITHLSFPFFFQAENLSELCVSGTGGAVSAAFLQRLPDPSLARLRSLDLDGEGLEGVELAQVLLQL